MADDLNIGIKVTSEGAQLIAAVNTALGLLRTQLGVTQNQLAAFNAQGRQTAASTQQMQATLSQLANTLQSTASAQRSMNTAQQAGGSAAQSMGSDVLSLVKALAALAIIHETIDGIKEFIKIGFAFNATMEGSTIGIAALITAQSSLVTSQGRVLTGSEALAAGQVLATDQLDKLRAAAGRTQATMSELIQAFQQAVGVSLRFGLTLDQAREFTVSMVKAASALQLPLNQMNEEIRSLLGGTINPRNTRIAAALGITNEEIKAAQRAGTLFEFVQSKLVAFDAAGEATAKTLVGITNNARRFLEVFAGAATKPLFDLFKAGALAGLSDVFDFDTASVSQKLTGILDVARDVFGRLGELLNEGMTAAVSGAHEFNDWLVRSAEPVNAILRSMGLVAGELGAIVRDASDLTLALGRSASEAGFLATTFTGIGLAAAIIHTLLKDIALVIGVVGSLILSAILGSFGLVAIIVGKIAGLVDKELGQSIVNAGREAVRFAEDAARAVIGYGKALLQGEDAIDKYLAKVKDMDRVLADDKGNRAARDQLRETTATIRREEGELEKILANSLAKKLITREQYETRLNALRLGAVKSELMAVLNASRSTTDQSEQKQLQNQIKLLQERRKLLERGVKTVTRPQPPDEAEAKRRQAAAEKLANAVAQSEIRVAKAVESTKEKSLKESLERQQLSYDDFYDRLSGIQAESIDKQIAANRKALATITDPAKREALLGEIQSLSDKIGGIFAENDARALEANKRLDDLVLQANINTLRDMGQFVAAARLEFEKEFAKPLKFLELKGDTKGASALKGAFDTKLVRSQFDELNADATRSLDAMQAKLAETQALVQSHAISEREARERIIAVYEATSDELGRIIPQLDEIAEKTHDERAIESVRRLKQQYLEMGITLAQTRDGFFKLKEAGRDATQSALAGLFEGITKLGTQDRTEIKALGEQLASARQELEDLLATPSGKRTSEQNQRITALRSEIEQTNVALGNAKDSITTWKDLFIQAAQSIVDALIRVSSQMLATAIIERSLTFLGGLGGSGSGATLSGGPLPDGRLPGATGGLVLGPGSGTSDSIPAWLSNREFVQPAHAVAYYGADWMELQRRRLLPRDAVRALLAGMHPMELRSRRSITHYAEGGLVSAGSMRPSGSGETHHVRIVAPPGFQLEQINSPEGARVIVQLVSERSNAFNAALGR